MAKGVFGPSFADSDNTDQLQFQKRDMENKREKIKGKGKHKMNTGESLSKYSACGLLRHTLPNYLYVFPEKAKEKFHAHEDRQKEVNKKLKEDDQLRKKVDKLRSKKKKEEEANSSGKNNQD